jgi:hypothetical protein
MLTIAESNIRYVNLFTHKVSPKQLGLQHSPAVGQLIGLR